MIHKLQKALIGLGQQLQNSPKAGFWIGVRVSIPQGMRLSFFTQRLQMLV